MKALKRQQRILKDLYLLIEAINERFIETSSLDKKMELSRILMILRESRRNILKMYFDIEDIEANQREV